MMKGGPWHYGGSQCWSPDGEWLATGRYSQLELWRPNGSQGPAVRTQGKIVSVAWRSESRQVAYGDAFSAVAVVDTKSGQTEWLAVLLDHGQSASLSPAGEILHGDPEVIEKELVYLVETLSGTLELLKPSEFQQRVAAGQ
jgi:hypothetical protein